MSTKHGGTPSPTRGQAVELDERALGQVSAGGLGSLIRRTATITPDHRRTPPEVWRIDGFDGKGNDVVTEEVTLVVEKV